MLISAFHSVYYSGHEKPPFNWHPICIFVFHNNHTPAGVFH